MNMKKQDYIYIVLYLFFIFVTLSCTEEDERNTDKSEKMTYTITYHISTRSSSDINASDDEMMKTILLFIVDADNKIEKKVTETLPSTEQQHEVEVQLTAGKKNVYGFSNLTAEMITATGLNVEEGEMMPSLVNATCAIANGYEIDLSANKGLPMSNQTTFSVMKTAGQTFGMELIRMVCKIKLNFKNETGHTITLKNIILSPVTTSAIYLMPHLDGQMYPQLPGSTASGDYTYAFNGSSTFADKGELKDYLFYINESQVSGDSWFKFTLNTQREGLVDEVRMSLTNLSYLNRNDYLPLDIILTDYKLELEVKSYPPIGGYPAAVEKEADGYHCIFPGGGPFVIIPKLIKLSDGSSVSVADADWNFSYVDATTTVFDKAPILKNGEIKGTMKSSASDKVLCTVSVNVLASGNVTRMLSYKVYISQN